MKKEIKVYITIFLLLAFATFYASFGGYYNFIAKAIVKKEVMSYVSRMYPEYEIVEIAINYKGFESGGYTVYCWNEDRESMILNYDRRSRPNPISDSHRGDTAKLYIKKFVDENNENLNRIKESLSETYNIKHISYWSDSKQLYAVYDDNDIYEKYKQGTPLVVPVILGVQLNEDNNPDFISTVGEFKNAVYLLITLQNKEDVICTGINVLYNFDEGNTRKQFRFEFEGDLKTLDRESISNYIQSSNFGDISYM